MLNGVLKAVTPRSLNTMGEQRAKCLALTLERTGITQIYVTEIKRTRQTAAPLAEELHLQPKTVPRDDIDELVKDLKAAGNAKVLVVAHADTLPKILAQLGAGALPEAKPNEQNAITLSSSLCGMGSRNRSV